MTDTVLFDVQDQIATITINRPEVLNALNNDVRDQLIELTSRVESDGGIRCLVLRGAGDNFCAGGDIKMFREIMQHDNETRRRQYRQFLHTVHIALLTMARMPQPVIAAVQGAAAGIGLSFVLAADLAIAADDAKFGESCQYRGGTGGGQS